MTAHPAEEARPDNGAGAPVFNRQVNWYETFCYAEQIAANAGVALDHQLIAGTPRWCGMPDDDARKLLALVLGGVREALANDIGQEAMAEASREISGAVDWSAVARNMHRRSDVYIRRAS